MQGHAGIPGWKMMARSLEDINVLDETEEKKDTLEAVIRFSSDFLANTDNKSNAKSKSS